MPRSDTNIQNVVQSTTNYDKFKLIGANRDIKEAHVRRLKKSITEKGNLTKISPVIVNEKYEVIDGQHRVTACRELGEPVYFTIVPGTNVQDARQMNLLHYRWDAQAFLKTYAAEGRRPYIEFNKLMEDYPDMSFSVVLACVAAEHPMGIQATFRRGELERFNVIEVRDRLDKLSELAEVNDAFKTRTMAYAFLRATFADKFNYNFFLQKVTEKGANLKAYQSVVDNLRQLEAIYNFNRGVSNHRIRFF